MGAYAVEADLVDRYGQRNIAQWSNLDNLATGIDSARVTRSIDLAEAEINDKFRNGPYSVPFAFASTVASLIVKEWNVVLAAESLFRARKVNSPNNPTEPKTNAVVNHKRDVVREMNLYRAGTRRLDAGLTHTGPTAMVVF